MVLPEDAAHEYLALDKIDSKSNQDYCIYPVYVWCDGKMKISLTSLGKLLIDGYVK